MSFNNQRLIATSTSLMERVSACAAFRPTILDPYNWAFLQSWNLSAQPGWVDAFVAATEAGVTDPGADESVITDDMISAAVLSLEGGGE